MSKFELHEYELHTRKIILTTSDDVSELEAIARYREGRDIEVVEADSTEYVEIPEEYGMFCESYTADDMQKYSEIFDDRRLVGISDIREIRDAEVSSQA